MGEELAKTSYAFKTLADMGVHVSYGTDSPVEDMNPYNNLYCAVTLSLIHITPPAFCQHCRFCRISRRSCTDEVPFSD